MTKEAIKYTAVAVWRQIVPARTKTGKIVVNMESLIIYTHRDQESGKGNAMIGA